MKKDLELGVKIHELLKSQGIETPMMNYRMGSLKERTADVAELFERIMQKIGLDLKDDSLQDTPMRVAKMFMSEIFEGLEYSNFPKCTAVENKMNYDEMIVIKDISVSSVCEHHFQNIDGVCKIAYIPNGKVLGLSKFNRIVRFFSKRPQIQERLTEQIHATLCYILDTDKIAVEIEAIHFCVKARGIEDKNSATVTRKLSGVFREDHEVRNEFLNS